MADRASRSRGRAAAIAASVASWNTTYGGTDWLRACAVRHALSLSNTAGLAAGLTADPAAALAGLDLDLRPVARRISTRCSPLSTGLLACVRLFFFSSRRRHT